MVNGPRFRATVATITALTSFFRAAKSAANQLNKAIAEGSPVMPELPQTNIKPKLITVGFDFKATMKDGTFKTFYNFTADLPEGATPQEIKETLEDIALEVKSARYEIDVVHIIIRTSFRS